MTDEDFEATGMTIDDLLVGRQRTVEPSDIPPDLYAEVVRTFYPEINDKVISVIQKAMFRGLTLAEAAFLPQKVDDES